MWLLLSVMLTAGAQAPAGQSSTRELIDLISNALPQAEQGIKSQLTFSKMSLLQIYVGELEDANSSGSLKLKLQGWLQRKKIQNEIVAVRGEILRSFKTLTPGEKTQLLDLIDQYVQIDQENSTKIGLNRKEISRFRDNLRSKLDLKESLSRP